MTDEMGYRNIDRVYELSQQGRLSKESGGTLTLDLLALSMMTYMARKAIDKEDRKAIAEGKPYWCYWGGWDSMAATIGMVLPTDEQREHAFEDESVADAISARQLTARNRLSRTAKFLKERGCIKMLKAPVTFARENAIWLLRLGETEEENATAEAWARKCLNL
ncbi:hypothetical protein [Bifidobacterium sp. SO1]|uniref:hypothetical protein n=1 Tax=Bifidobacterium sp. SO1 TaxID=2809029 RepID=UPI001BDC1378|nr:hypothetical protein [Bifidobacterium sp. SO1]MBT1161192.1 hypothetical protein [Bifidobacterium sp. SO1]